MANADAVMNVFRSEDVLALDQETLLQVLNMLGVDNAEMLMPATNPQQPIMIEEWLQTLEWPQRPYLQRHPSQVDGSKSRLLLVMDSLPELDLVFQAVKDNVVVIKVNFTDWTLGDLVENIRDAIGDPNHQLSSVGILNHGDPGKIGLLKSVNGGAVTLGCIQDSDEVQKFFKFLAEYVAQDDEYSGFDDPRYRIDLLCCSVAQGPEGEKLIQSLEEVTGINCAGSRNKIGHEQMGGNWFLETEDHLGSVDACYFHEEKIQEWVHVCGWGTWIATGAAIGLAVAAAPAVVVGTAAAAATTTVATGLTTAAIAGGGAGAASAGFIATAAPIVAGAAVGIPSAGAVLAGGAAAGGAVGGGAYYADYLRRGRNDWYNCQGL